MLFGPQIDHEALKRECETWCAATRVYHDARALNMHAASRRAREIADTAEARGLKPEHVKAYLDGRL